MFGFFCELAVAKSKLGIAVRPASPPRNCLRFCINGSPDTNCDGRRNLSTPAWRRIRGFLEGLPLRWNLPVIGAKRRSWQALGIVQVALGIIGPGISRRHGLRNLGAR